MQNDPTFHRRRDDALTHSNAAECCPDCDAVVRQDGTEFVCTDCGLIVEEDTLNRVRVWTTENETGRGTGPERTPTRHDRGLSTTIGH